MLPAPLQRKKQPPSPQQLATRKAAGSLFAGFAVALAVIGTLLQIISWSIADKELRMMALTVSSVIIAPLAGWIAGTCWQSDNIRGATWGRSLMILLIHVSCLTFLIGEINFLWGALCPGPLLWLAIESSLQSGLKRKKKVRKPYP
jgi:hypothetical protein